MAADKSHLRKNSEKASVAAIVANNNEVLSKLIAGEISKVGFNGKNASNYIKSSTSDIAVAQVRQEAYEKETPLNEGWISELGSVVVDKVKGAYDFMSSDEGIDRRGVDGSGQEYLTSAATRAASMAHQTTAADKARIKLMDDAHYSLSGQAAREQQGLSWYQPLNMSTVGGNTRHNRGGLDAQGDYLDQDFMSFDTPENFTGKKITTNLRSAKDIELFGDSLNQINEINMVSGSESLKNFKDKERIVTSLIDGQDPADADNYAIQKIKENANFQTQLELVQDERSKLQIVSDAIDAATKPTA